MIEREREGEAEIHEGRYVVFFSPPPVSESNISYENITREIFLLIDKKKVFISVFVCLCVSKCVCLCICVCV